MEDLRSYAKRMALNQLTTFINRLRRCRAVAPTEVVFVAVTQAVF